MRDLTELTFKVPAPFVGVQNLGFSARVPAQSWNERLRDVPIVIEGPAEPMERLHYRLERFPQVPSSENPYIWTPPVMLSDEVCVMAFKDRSLSYDPAPIWSKMDQLQLSNHVSNLVQPMALTFLRDCARHGNLKLSEELIMVVEYAIASPNKSARKRLEFHLKRPDIIQVNGRELLGGF